MLLEDYKSTGSSNPIYTRLYTLSSRKIFGLFIVIISVNKNRYHDCQDKQRKCWIPAFVGMTAMLNRL